MKFVNDYINDAYFREDNTACAKELKRQFKKNLKEQSEEFFFLLDKYIEDRKIEKSWTDNYYAQWTFFMKDLKEFNPKLKFSMLSTSLMNDYVEYLSNRMVDSKIKEYLKKFREFIKYVSRRGYKVNKDFEEYKPTLHERSKETMFLTKDELTRINALDYSHKGRLDRVRDMFVFQCCTSLRFSDFKRLTHKNIRPVNNGSGHEILLVTEKDNGTVWFPLSKTAERIYLKYKENGYDDGLAFPIISGDKYRKYLAEVGKDAKIEGTTKTTNFSLGKRVEKERERYKLGTHDARRTFIVQAINGGATFEQVSLFTSHSEVEQMKPYITLTQDSKKDVLEIIDNIIK